MSSLAAPRCRHIKVNGTQCGSPALRHKNFCFYHHQDRPLKVPCYYEQEYPLGEITLPYFEDAHSIQSVLRQVVQMVMQKRLERKTASLLLYALQIASSNLKRMELEKPQPEQVVTHLATESATPMAARDEEETARENSDKSSTSAQPANRDQEASPVNASTQTNEDEDKENDRSGEDLPPGTIQACYQPAPQMRTRPRQNHQRKQQYVI